MASKGLMIAGLASGSGKTMVTLGLLRALARRGKAPAAGKTGPDYIDSGFLSAAAGRKAVNLDQIAMSKPLLARLAADQAGDTLIIEGVMGLFDGASDNAGSSAALAEALAIPVILVMDIRHTAQTAAMIAAGIASLLPAGRIAGVILNHVASPRHLALVSEALAAHQISLFGSVPSRDGLAVPSRHLGLVQAADFDNACLEVILDHAADLIDEYCDLDAILDAAQGLPAAGKAVAALPLPLTNPQTINPPAKTIAVANDAAFGFAYHHLLAGWQQQGAEIRPFSPLNDEKPADDADFIFLPGGYPELHLPTLSTNCQFLAGLTKAATANIPIYGECGGYMVLGTGITDASGNRFDMAGLLDVETSFANKKRHLGYRKFTPVEPFFWDGPFLGHEFHYTNVVSASGTPLFTAHDANDQPLGMAGLRKGSVAGSYLHIIAQS
ncbi:cobyrinate a,c-diamide synthase [Candidatus Puniceispirillum sp.]|nr:cobyrinate a,c-diamide synthase [Candidatus Puniceispirillum sp.]